MAIRKSFIFLKFFLFLLYSSLSNAGSIGYASNSSAEIYYAVESSESNQEYLILRFGKVITRNVDDTTLFTEIISKLIKNEEGDIDLSTIKIGGNKGHRMILNYPESPTYFFPPKM